jgi:hypothetical protein
MKSFSQAGQDLFVHALLPKTDGTFLDIGCCHPTELSNTYALEQLGWSGLLVDNDINAAILCQIKRGDSRVIHGDATKIDWQKTLHTYHPKWNGHAIDYLSLDVDEASADALAAILNAGARFRVITAEHDRYRNGERLRAPMRVRLFNEGYVLICGDVCATDGSPFEDWWVDKELSEAANRFRCEHTKWPDIIARI